MRTNYNKFVFKNVGIAEAEVEKKSKKFRSKNTKLKIKNLTFIF